MAYIPKNYARLEVGYREKALKLFPWVCGRCSREFVYSNLRELTVHHIDHDHSNNPEDGSNWEMLCLYCHDHEHSKYTEADQYGSTVVAGEDAQKSVGEATYNPFAVESDDEQKVSGGRRTRSIRHDAIRRAVTRRRNVSPPAGGLLQFNGGDRLRHDAKILFQLLFALHYHLPAGVDGHVLGVGVIPGLPEHHQLQAIFLLLRRQRDAIRPFSQLYRRRQTLIHFRRHTVDNLLNIHLPLTSAWNNLLNRFFNP